MSGLNAMTVLPATRIGHPVSTSEQLLALAEEYQRAAQVLEGFSRSGAPMSRAPFRLTAIHAIELYLSAFLLSTDQTPEMIRSYGHNLALRTAIATQRGLILRLRTVSHLSRLSDTREYLMSRYATDQLANLSEPTRLAATLEEIGKKVRLKLTAPVKVKASIVHPPGRGGPARVGGDTSAARTTSPTR